MREIVIPRNITSPIKIILPKLHLAITNVAREKERIFAAECKDYSLNYIQSDDFIVRAYVQTKEIFFSTFVLEFLWVTSWVSIRFYDFIAGRNPVDSQTIDATAMSNEFQAMQWAYDKLLSRRSQTIWPSQIPLPFLDITPSVPHTYEELCKLRARDTMMSAFAYYFHHEMAHIRLNHNPVSDFSIDQERDADRQAAQFLLEGADPNNLLDWLIQRRYLGVSIGLNALLSRGIYTRKFHSDSHPRSFDRLAWILNEYITDADNEIYAFNVVILKLHIQLGIKEWNETDVSGSWKDKLEQYFDLFGQKSEEWLRIERLGAV